MNRPGRPLVAGALALSVAAVTCVAAWWSPRAGVSGGDPSPAGPGAATVGSTEYRIPDGAVVVAPSGDDGASGTAGAPLRTVGQAVARAPDGGTIVLRGGTYHESVTIPAGRRLTVQSHPGEAAWLDGSSRVDGWRRDGRAWVRDGWTAKFDASPSYTPGAPPSDDPDFQFVDPAHPMAAHPDQVWFGNDPQRQVGSRAEVTKGTFYVDERAQRLYLGSDPAGRDVRASTLSEAITIRGARSTLRGIGVRRYATSLPQMGSVKVMAAGVTLENVAVTDSATTGLSVLATGARIRRVTSTRNGLLGIHGNHSDDLRIELSRASHNNRERFKQAPVSGGIKITRSRGVTVTRGVLADNLGKGVWLDESVDGATVTGNRVLRNAGHGVVLELSARAVVADNLVRGNGGDGLRVNGTDDVRIWNNTLTGNGRTVHLVQDARRPSSRNTPGLDPRRPFPDPTMTWLLGRIQLSANVLADPHSGAPCLLCVEDHTHRRTASQMGITANGNLYIRPGPTKPRTLVVWSQGEGAPATFTTLKAFRTATAQERQGTAEDSPNVARADGALDPALAKRAARTTPALPAAIAKLIGRPAGARHPGTWRIS